MKNVSLLFLFSTIIIMGSCVKKTDKDRAVELIRSKYKNTDQKLDFDNAKLDSLYNISPEAYADSIKKGNQLDTALAMLESQIEHLPQKESDSVGLISAKLTKERYRLLEVAKTKPSFLGWKLSDVKVKNEDSPVLSFNFDKGITKVIE